MIKLSNYVNTEDTHHRKYNLKAERTRMIFLSKLLGQKLKKTSSDKHTQTAQSLICTYQHTHVLRKLGGGAGFLKQHFEPLQP